MIYKEKILEINKPWSKHFDRYFSVSTIGFFDIESTGLSAARNFMILGGILLWDGKSFTLKQYLAEDKKEESKLLVSYFKELLKCDILVSYNGINFDQIFINKRFEQNLIPAKLGYTDEYGITFHNFFHLDLFALVRSCTNFNKFLPDLKQKTVEKYLNIDENRDDLISGAESVTLYDRYMSSRDESILNQILLHNSDDCIQLAYLTKLFGKTDIHRIAFLKGFPVFDKGTGLFIKSLKFRGNQLIVSGSHKGVKISYKCYEMYYRFELSTGENEFKLIIELDNLKDGYRILDLKKFPVDINKFKDMPNCKFDYLLLSKDDTINYRECNFFSKAMLLFLIKESRCSDEN